MWENGTKAEGSKKSENTIEISYFLVDNYDYCNQHMAILKKFGDFNIVAIRLNPRM